MYPGKQSNRQTGVPIGDIITMISLGQASFRRDL